MCWVRNKTKDGYGRFSRNGKRTYAHRAAYETWVGEIPKGLYVLHKCDNPPCINPAHLFVGTHHDNMADMVLKNRASRLVGEKNGGGGKLSELDVISILLDTRKRAVIADAFGVSIRMIAKIRSGEKWSYLRPSTLVLLYPCFIQRSVMLFHHPDTSFKRLASCWKRASSFARGGVIDQSHGLAPAWSNTKMMVEARDWPATEDDFVAEISYLDWFAWRLDEWSKENMLEGDRTVAAILYEWKKLMPVNPLFCVDHV